MDLNYFGKLKELRARCENAGLSLKYEEDFNPRTNGREIIVQTPNPLWGDKSRALWNYTVEHELSHNDPEMKKQMVYAASKGVDPKSFFGSVLNLLDDYRIELNGKGEYIGRDKALDQGRALFYDRWDEEAIALLGKNPDPHRQAMEALFVWDALLRSNFQPSTTGYGEKYLSSLNATQLEWVKKLFENGYGEKLDAIPSPPELFELAKTIIDEVFQFDADQEEKESQGKGKGDGKGDEDSTSSGGGDKEEGGEQKEGSEGTSDRSGPDSEGAEGGASGTGEEPPQGDENSKAESKSTGGELKEAKGEETSRREAGKVDYTDLLAHIHPKDMEEMRGGVSYSPLEIDYDKYEESRTTKEWKSINPDRHEINNMDNSSYAPERGYMVAVNALNVGNGLANKVRRLLQARAQTTYRHGLKSGKISGRSVYRATIKGNHPSNRRVFRKKQINHALDTSVSILVDQSGSMGGPKMTHAIKSAMLLNEAISSLGIPLEIITFYDRWRHPVQNIVKSFNKKLSSEEVQKRFCMSVAHGMGSNSDGEAILWTVDRLLRQQTMRKLLIVLSDGQPACSRGDAMAFTKQVVKQLESRPDMEVYGIGIMSNSVKKIYSHNRVIASAEELETAVLDVIKQNVMNK